MTPYTLHQRPRRALRAALASGAAGVLSAAFILAGTPAVAQTQAKAQPASQDSTVSAALRQIGRVATPDEVRAWDIDVRADFKGLPKGSGTVSQGQDIWEQKCASCHGVFGESNEVFTPIVGGTTKNDIATGRVANLAKRDYPQRTTLMKVSKLSTLWDYINRAMPWNAPKSLTSDEVYAVLAYILNLADVLPADATLSDANIAQAQARLPNRNGKAMYANLWDPDGKGDVVNALCMSNCAVDEGHASALPDYARDSHGNIADQTRPFGAPRGTDTSIPRPGDKQDAAVLSMAAKATDDGTAKATVTAAAKAEPKVDVNRLMQANGCTACHGLSSKIVGPSFRDIAKRYAGKADAVDYLGTKIRQGGTGVWGPVPMPEQAQLKDADRRAIAEWLSGGAK